MDSAFLRPTTCCPSRRRAIIIVMLTTSLHPQDVDRMGKLNIAGFLNKPLTEEKINEVLHNHFDRSLPGT